MSRQTKIAVAIGGVLIVASVWYLSREGPKTAPVVAQNESSSATASTDQPTPTVSLTDNDPVDGTARPGARPRDDSSRAASPSPRRIEDTAGALSANPGLRPKPEETHEPVPPMQPTEFPTGRSGLSSVMPNMGAPALDPSAAASGDMPPNADRTAKPADPVLPPIQPLGLAGGATTRPSTALPVVADKPAENKTVPLAAKPSPPALSLAGNLAAKPAAPPEKPKPRTHVVKAGDSFSKIAVEWFGSAKYADAIMKANPGKDPRKLYVGAKLIIPETPPGATDKTDKTEKTTKTETTAVTSTPKPPVSGNNTVRTTTPEPRRETYKVPPPDPNRSYTVQPGEGWFELARKFLGDGKNYPELYEYNKDRVGGDPMLLRAGTVIELPPRAKLPEKSSTATPSTK